VQDIVNRFIRISLFLAAFILLGLIFGYITFKILSFSRTVEVPSLVNMTLVEANDALNKAGLNLNIGGEDYDPSTPAGKILRQDIPPGNKVKERRAIKVVVSKGPRVYSVPPIVNETLSDAETTLLEKGLRIGRVINVHSDSVEKGRIVAQRPEPDERLTESITVLVSLGPHELTYYCPDFVNMTLDDAKQLTDKIGLTIEAKGTGLIIRSQRPKPGTPIKSGGVVYFETREESGND
jgi:beta-lactam-binding protein with PASTA domain